MIGSEFYRLPQLTDRFAQSRGRLTYILNRFGRVLPVLTDGVSREARFAGFGTFLVQERIDPHTNARLLTAVESNTYGELSRWDLDIDADPSRAMTQTLYAGSPREAILEHAVAEQLSHYHLGSAAVYFARPSHYIASTPTETAPQLLAVVP